MPTTSDRPDQSAGCKGRPREKVRLSPRRLCQLRPSRPRPAVCCSATSSTGSGRGATLAEPRKRRISSLLVESISGNTSTVKPGKAGASATKELIQTTQKDGRQVEQLLRETREVAAWLEQREQAASIAGLYGNSRVAH